MTNELCPVHTEYLYVFFIWQSVKKSLDYVVSIIFQG